MIPFKLHENDEIAKLLRTDHTPTSMAHPLEIFMPRDFLIELLESSLATIRGNRTPERESEGDREFIDASISQRVDFLAQLNSTTDPEVYVAIYPVDLEAEAEIEREIMDAESPDDLFPGGGGGLFS